MQFTAGDYIQPRRSGRGPAKDFSEVGLRMTGQSLIKCNRLTAKKIET